jgi:predicted XRE-type DNA-binding protein
MTKKKRMTKKKPVARKKKLDYEVTEGNIFAALERPNADELLARAKLLDNVSSLIKNSGLSQGEVAKRLGISQPKVSMLVTGRLSQFSSDTLMHYLSILGCAIQIRVTKPRSTVGIFGQRGSVAVM